MGALKEGFHMGKPRPPPPKQLCQKTSLQPAVILFSQNRSSQAAHPTAELRSGKHYMQCKTNSKVELSKIIFLIPNLTDETTLEKTLQHRTAFSVSQPHWHLSSGERDETDLLAALPNTRRRPPGHLMAKVGQVKIRRPQPLLPDQVSQSIIQP